MTIDQLAARSFLLDYHFLSGGKTLSGPDGVMEYMHRVRAVQFDPIDRAGTNPDLVFQSRLSDYDPRFLRGLLYRDRKLVDHFDKELCIYKIEDWPFLYPRRKGYEDYSRTGAREKNLFDYHGQIEDHLKKNGPCCSGELDLGESLSWYWGSNTSLSRAVLEHMYYCGRVLVSRKDNRRKYYDLAANILPTKISRQKAHATEEQYRDWYMLRRVAGLGLIWNKSGSAWLGTFDQKTRQESLDRLVKKKKLTRINLANHKSPFYIPSPHMDLLEKGNDNPSPDVCRFLAPLDNFLWDRNQIEALFGFSYVWEIYKPENKRLYGYYVLPVLFGNRFAARFEPVADRKKKILTVKNWWWEPDFPQKLQSHKAFRLELENFMRYLGCTDMELEKAASDKLKFLRARK